VLKTISQKKKTKKTGWIPTVFFLEIFSFLVLICLSAWFLWCKKNPDVQLS
jgi:ABC-type nickel/cobalt efflux system permease component RcnA